MQIRLVIALAACIAPLQASPEHVESYPLNFDQWLASEHCKAFKQSPDYKKLEKEVYKNTMIARAGFATMTASAAYVLYTATRIAEIAVRRSYRRSYSGESTDTSVATELLVKAGLGVLGTTAGGFATFVGALSNYMLHYEYSYHQYTVAYENYIKSHEAQIAYENYVKSREV